MSSVHTPEWAPKARSHPLEMYINQCLTCEWQHLRKKQKEWPRKIRSRLMERRYSTSPGLGPCHSRTRERTILYSTFFDALLFNAELWSLSLAYSRNIDYVLRFDDLLWNAELLVLILVYLTDGDLRWDQSVSESAQQLRKLASFHCVELMHCAF